MELDASDYALGGVLNKFRLDNMKHQIAFYSRRLTTTERRYGTPDHELLSIAACFKVRRYFFKGAPHPVTVLTDRSKLRFFLRTKKLNRKQVHWTEAIRLSLCQPWRRRNIIPYDSWRSNGYELIEGRLDVVKCGQHSHRVIKRYKTQMTFRTTLSNPFSEDKSWSMIDKVGPNAIERLLPINTGVLLESWG